MISISPSFFRSVSHDWTLKALKAVYCKLTDAKMCECDMNIPLRYQWIIFLWVLWFIYKEITTPSLTLPSTGPSLAFPCTASSFPKTSSPQSHHRTKPSGGRRVGGKVNLSPLSVFPAICGIWGWQRHAGAFDILWEDPASFQHNCMLLF